MLYKDNFFMLASTFNDVLTGLQARDTAVEMHKLNRMIVGPSALALHGIETGAKPDTLHLTVYEPNSKQINYIAQEVANVVCGITGKALPILEMAELNLFSLTVRDLTLIISFERDKQVPPNALLFRYGSSFYRVMGINDISTESVQKAAHWLTVKPDNKIEFTPIPVINAPRIGQEFLDEPLPTEDSGYSVKDDIEKVCKAILNAGTLKKLASVFETYEILKRCNTIDVDTDTYVRQIASNREKKLRSLEQEIDPEG